MAIIGKNEEYGLVSTESLDYNKEKKHWFLKKLKHVKFDTLVILCFSDDLKLIEGVYIIPREKLLYIDDIIIHKDISIDNEYEIFRVDEKPYQASFEEIMKKE